MRLNPISGQTCVIEGLTHVGVYFFNDKTCLLIDTGPADDAVQVRNIIEQEGYRIAAIINTHSHADHCGGNQEIQLYHNSVVYASPHSAPLIQHPVFQAAGLFSASPPKILHNKFIVPPASKVEFIIEPGELMINGQTFYIIDLEGHSAGHIGIKTPDGVIFAGDSLLPPGILKEFPFLYLYDVDRFLQSLDLLNREKHCSIYLSHSGYADDLEAIIAANRAVVEKILQLIISFAAEARTREEIIAYLIRELKLPFNQVQYYLIHASISACISYLCSIKTIRSLAADNVIKFQAK